MNAETFQPISYKLRPIIVKNLLHEDTLKEGAGRLSREIRLFKMIEQAGHNDPQFWVSLDLGFKIRSIGWLKNAGINVLNYRWNQYYADLLREKELDEAKRADIMRRLEMVNGAGTVEGILKNYPAKSVSAPKKKTLLQLIDE